LLSYRFKLYSKSVDGCANAISESAKHKIDVNSPTPSTPRQTAPETILMCSTPYFHNCNGLSLEANTFPLPPLLSISKSILFEKEKAALMY
jgi:hypothetical protein